MSCIEGNTIEGEAFDNGPRQLTVGINGAINLDPFAWYGEIDLRQATADDLERVGLGNTNPGRGTVVELTVPTTDH